MMRVTSCPLGMSEQDGARLGQAAVSVRHSLNWPGWPGSGTAFCELEGGDRAAPALYHGVFAPSEATRRRRSASSSVFVVAR
jgi:hypothetical protein